VHVLMLVLFVFWGAYFLFCLWRFSAKRNPRASHAGMQSHWSTYGEVGVAVVEAVLLLVFSIPLWGEWTSKPKAELNPLEIRVTAEQFAWNVHYPGADGVFGHRDAKFVSSTNTVGLDPNDPAGKDDVVMINQLHVELNRAGHHSHHVEGRHPQLLPPGHAREAGRHPGDGSAGPFHADQDQRRRDVGDRLRAALRQQPLPDARAAHRRYA
jgi:hypothetical protein